MIVDDIKQQKINQDLFYIEQKAKEIYQMIFDPKIFPC